MNVRVDHVLLGVRDLDAAADALRREHGLDSLVGGRHPGWGTGNRIVPLGDSYLELIAVMYQEEARSSAHPLAARLTELTREGDGLLGWCAAPDDFEETCQRLGLSAITGSRTRPGGPEVRWRLAGLEASLVEPCLPFFIEWDDRAQHPGRMAVAHAVAARGFARLELQGDVERITTWIGDAGLPVRATAGDPAILAAVIETDRDEIVLR